MSIIRTKAIVTSNIEIAEGIFSIWIKKEEITKEATAGQFIALYSKDSSRMLPRPISICEIDRDNGLIRLVFRVVGAGTKEFSSYHPGDLIEVMGPLGNGFTKEGKHVLLIGGGIGIPPMLELAKQLDGSKDIILGYRDQLFLNEEFEKYGSVHLSTEDGSSGIKGNVIDVIKQKKLTGDIIYACGPIAMLQGVKAFAEEQGIRAQISIEEKMACGIGACLACVCKSKEKDEHTNVHNKRICKEGPVFYAAEVELA